MIIQQNRTVFKGCLRSGGMFWIKKFYFFKFFYLYFKKDELTFKSKRYRTNPGFKLDFYINDLFEDQIISCCEHSLLNKNSKYLFQFERVIGTKPCQE